MWAAGVSHKTDNCARSQPSGGQIVKPKRKEQETSTVGRGFDDRYGSHLVGRGIATFPVLLLRWQAGLGLGNGELVTLLHVLSYYRQGGKWPSVSINALAEARDVARGVVEGEISQLEAKGYVARAGTDGRFGTFFYDLGGLFATLEEFVIAEQKLADLRRQQTQLRASALRGRFGHKETDTENEIKNKSKRTHRQREQTVRTDSEEGVAEFESGTRPVEGAVDCRAGAVAAEKPSE